MYIPLHLKIYCSFLKLAVDFKTLPLSILLKCNNSAFLMPYWVTTCFAKPNQEWERQPYSSFRCWTDFNKIPVQLAVWFSSTLENLLNKSKKNSNDLASSVRISPATSSMVAWILINKSICWKIHLRLYWSGLREDSMSFSAKTRSNSTTLNSLFSMNVIKCSQKSVKPSIRYAQRCSNFICQNSSR